jgi:hypothetical protein
MTNVNKEIAEAVTQNEAAQVVLSQRKPCILFQGYATKVSHLGVKVDYKTIDQPFTATDMFEAQLKAIDLLGGTQALMSDIVGRWELTLNTIG